MKKLKFNVIDLLIIILIVAVIFAGVYILGSKTGTQTNTKAAEVVLVIEEKDIDSARMEYYMDRVKEGDSVTVGIKEKVQGTLGEIEITPAKTIYENPKTGEKTWVDKLDKYDIKVPIRLTITETEKDFLIGTAKVKVGKQQNFVGKGYSGYGTVISIERVGGDK